MRTDWKGVFVVAVTPFDNNGVIDEGSFATLLDTYVSDGVDGVVVAGSTGEWSTLHDEERLRLFEIARTRLPAGVKAASIAVMEITKGAQEVFAQVIEAINGLKA